MLKARWQGCTITGLEQQVLIKEGPLDNTSSSKWLTLVLYPSLILNQNKSTRKSKRARRSAQASLTDTLMGHLKMILKQSIRITFTAASILIISSWATHRSSERTKMALVNRSLLTIASLAWASEWTRISPMVILSATTKILLKVHKAKNTNYQT